MWEQRYKGKVLPPLLLGRCYHFTFYGKAPPTNHTILYYSYLHTEPCLEISLHLPSSFFSYYTLLTHHIITAVLHIAAIQDKYSHTAVLVRRDDDVSQVGWWLVQPQSVATMVHLLLLLLLFEIARSLMHSSYRGFESIPGLLLQLECTYWHYNKAYIKTFKRVQSTNSSRRCILYCYSILAVAAECQ